MLTYILAYKYNNSNKIDESQIPDPNQKNDYVNKNLTVTNLLLRKR